MENRAARRLEPRAPPDAASAGGDRSKGEQAEAHECSSRSGHRGCGGCARGRILVLIGHRRAIVARVADAVAVGVGLGGIPNVGAVVPEIREEVAVGVTDSLSDGAHDEMAELIGHGAVLSRYLGCLILGELRAAEGGMVVAVGGG